MHRSESWAYTVPLLCLQYCIIEDVFMLYILFQFVIYIYLHRTARFCFHYSTEMPVNILMCHLYLHGAARHNTPSNIFKMES